LLLFVATGFAQSTSASPTKSTPPMTSPNVSPNEVRAGDPSTRRGTNVPRGLRQAAGDGRAAAASLPVPSQGDAYHHPGSYELSATDTTQPEPLVSVEEDDFSHLQEGIDSTDDPEQRLDRKLWDHGHPKCFSQFDPKYPRRRCRWAGQALGEKCRYPNGLGTVRASPFPREEGVSKGDNKRFVSCNERDNRSKWYCGDYLEWFDTRGSDWNEIMIQYEEDGTVNFRTTYCAPLPRGVPDDGIEVTVETKVFGSTKCLHAAEREPSEGEQTNESPLYGSGTGEEVYGEDVTVALETCAGDNAFQSFYLFPTSDDSGSSFRLRPKVTAQQDIDVCLVLESRRQVRTWSCKDKSSAAVHLLKEGRLHSHQTVDFCIINDGGPKIEDCAAGNTNISPIEFSIKTKSPFSVLVGVTETILDGPKDISENFADEPAEGSALFLSEGSGLHILGLGWKKYEFSSTVSITKNTLFEYSISISQRPKVLFLCVETDSSTGDKHKCFDVYRDGPVDLLHHFMHELGDKAGSKAVAIGFRQGRDRDANSDGKGLGRSFFTDVKLSDTVDIKRYVGCFGDDSASGLTEEKASSGFSYDQCHKACFDDGYNYFGRSGNQGCVCGGKAAPIVHATSSSPQLCIDADYSRSSSEDRVFLETCESASLSQQWIYGADKTFRNGRWPWLCLEGGARYASVHIRGCALGKRDQQWELDNGRIRNRDHTTYVGVSGGCTKTNVKQGTGLENHIYYPTGQCSDQQKWNFGSLPPVTALSIDTMSLECMCNSAADIGGSTCVYSTGPQYQPQGEIIIEQDGNPITLKEAEASSTRYAGFVVNAEDRKGITIEGDIRLKLRPLNSIAIVMNRNTVFEFDFTFDDEASRQGVCFLVDDGNVQEACFYVSGEDVDNNDLVSNTDGGYAAEGVMSSFRLTFEDKFASDRDYYATILLVQESPELRSGSCKFENVLLYGLQNSTITKRGPDSVNIVVASADEMKANNLFFRSEILIQDDKGEHERFPAAEELGGIDPKNVIINRLKAGRRYRFTLTPVDNRNNDANDSLSYTVYLNDEVTSCSCESTSDDITGAPQNLLIQQRGGLITFQFKDNSVCEEAFAFTREHLREDSQAVDIILDSFAPNYLFYSTEECSNEVIMPGVEYSDSVLRSSLVVGEEYRYCIRAVGKDYMVNLDPSKATGQLVSSSAPSCKIHILHWEASTKVKVTLRKDAGELPVEGVTVAYELLDFNNFDTVLISDTTTTLQNGEVIIEFMELEINGHRFDGSKQYPLKLHLSKTTGSVDHEFLCDNEAVVCTNDGVITYLSHLQFSDTSTVHIVDSTSVPVEGTVSIGWPNAEYSGCPLRKAEVCLFRKQAGVIEGADTEDVCVETDAEGRYSLPATIGTRVYPKVQFADHEFVHLTEREVDYNRTREIERNGIYVTESGSGLRNLDFLDANTTDLIVEVAGGPCDFVLGNSVVEVKLCSAENGKKTFPAQSSVKHVYRVPSQEVEVRIESIEGRGDFITEQNTANGFFGKYVALDLTEVDMVQEADATTGGELVDSESPEGNNTSNNTTQEKDEQELLAEADAEAEENNLRTARFQYDGSLVIDVEMSPDRIGRCGSTSSDENFASNHVLKYKDIFDLTIFLRYEVLKAGDGYDAKFCDIVSDERVTVLNEVGLVESIDSDAAEIEVLAQREDESVVNLYTACTKVECILPVEPPIEGEEGRSKAVIRLGAGLPAVEKRITVQVSGKAVQHVAEVVVTGDLNDGGNSLSIPTHYPLLVIRDPPGGSSTASYSNVQSSLQITMDNYEVYEGWSGNLNFGLGAATEAETCAGIGVAACFKASEFKANAQVNLAYSRKGLNEYKHQTRSHGFTVTWSYSTSAEPIFSGAPSDVFLVPTFEVMFVETTTIFYDSTMCKAVSTETTKFDINSKDNENAVAFLSHRQVTEFVMPELKKVLEEKKGSTDARQEEIDTLQASVDAWQTFLNDYEETNEMADNDTLEHVGTWYQNHGNRRPYCEQKKRIKRGPCSFISAINIVQVACYVSTTKEERYEEEPNIVDALRRASGFLDKLTFTEYRGPEDWPGYVCYDSGDWEPIPEDSPYWAEWEVLHPTPKELASPIVSKSLLDNAERYDDASIGQIQSDLESTGSIYFSGGGSSLSVTLGSSQLEQLQQKLFEKTKLGGERHNYDHTITGATDAVFQTNVLGFEVQGDVGGSIQYDAQNRLFIQDDTQSDVSVSFALGDPNPGDEFLVKVFIDPKYGTFVFRTIRGVSKCPHEPGTSPGEVPRLDVQIPVASRFVKADEGMVFDLEVWNEGKNPSDFLLYTEDNDNSDGLRFFTTNTYLGVNATKNKATLRVLRGPKLYEYSPVRIYFRSKCEMELSSFGEVVLGSALDEKSIYNTAKEVDNATQRTIRYLEPCLNVGWAGDIQYNDAFTVNQDDPLTLEVKVFNPDASSRTMFDAPRVKAVHLQYRRHGDRQWLFAQTTSDDGTVNIDFAAEGIEDAYGFAEVPWDLSQLEQTTYEIRIQTECTQEGPPEYQTHLSTTVAGVIDRDPPGVYGLPNPQRHLIPGQELRIEFTEDISCDKPYRFTAAIKVAGIVDSFDLDDLDLMCSRNTIGIQLKEDEISYDSLLGREYTLELKNVQDLSLNSMDDYTYESNFMCRTPEVGLSIAHPAGTKPYLPHEPMKFEATLTNNGSSRSYAELGMELQTNTAAFKVLANGESLAMAREYVLEAGENITTTITISKGPGEMLKFSPIRLFLRSSCSSDRQNPVVVTADLFNYQETEDSDANWIVFTSPCPAIRWADPFHLRPSFVINKDALDASDSQLEVSIFNEDYVNRKLSDRLTENPGWNNRLEDVVLLYRSVGSKDWLEGRTKQSNGTPAHFATSDIEDEFGYSTLLWDIKEVLDAKYEVRVVSRCADFEHADNVFSSGRTRSYGHLSVASTKSITGTIDRIPPQVSGVPSLDRMSGPSSEFIIPFTEQLQCDTPFDFDLKLRVERNGSDDVVVTDGQGIHVTCQGYDVRYRFDNSSDVLGANMTLILSNVTDLARNVMATPYVSTFILTDATTADDVVGAVAETQDAITEAQDAITELTNAMTTQIERSATTRRLQVRDLNEAGTYANIGNVISNAYGLEFSVHCAPSPEMAKSAKGTGTVLTIGILVNSMSNSLPRLTGVNITEMRAFFMTSAGEFVKEDATDITTKDMGVGVLYVLASFPRSEHRIETSDDISSLLVRAEAGLFSKAVVFDYIRCHL